MAEKTVIATFSELKTHFACMQECFPSKIVFLGNGFEKKARQDAEKSIGVMARLEWIEINDTDIAEIAKTVIGIIEKEKDVTLHIHEGAGTLAIAALFAAYARSSAINGILYSPKDSADLIQLPKFSFSLSKTKKKTLGIMAKENETIVEVARQMGKTRAVVYRHIRDLCELGLLDKDWNLTDAGKVALL